MARCKYSSEQKKCHDVISNLLFFIIESLRMLKIRLNRHFYMLSPIEIITLVHKNCSDLCKPNYLPRGGDNLFNQLFMIVS